MGSEFDVIETIEVEVPEHVVDVARERYERRVENDPNADVRLEDYVWEHIDIELDL